MRRLRLIFSPLAAVKWALLALALLLLFNLFFTPGFFDVEVRDGRLYGTLVDVLNHGSKVAIVAVGMTLVIATAGIDLSVGAVVAIAGAVAATLIADHAAPWYLAVAFALLISACFGLWNGALVVALRLQPIVATLILMVAGRGVAQLITGGVITTYQDPRMTWFGNGSLFGLPVPVSLLALVALVCALATRRTSLGLFIESVGDNQPASRLAGVPDRAVRLFVYAFSGLCAGIAGIIECSYIKAADANNAGQLLELDAILAVVIGGTSLMGGRFLLVGSIIGALLMQTLTKTLYMQDVSADIAPAPKAAVVILVCLLQSPVVRERLARVRQLRKGAA
ncbi:MAG: ABC transporter permease [Leptolyngbya sp. PLA3]|nr:MAG: ABC transporter permease [Cyanobacteria bacterium CYA]MCE7969372.1 ABC transporter permease [Leptolyngbya sp. PL-A3]